jgi:hypothetical protein
MPSRKELRKQRWDLARSLKFNHIEARQMRDWSADRIRNQVRETRRELTAIPSNQRSESQSNRITDLRRFERRQNTDIQYRADIESMPDRQDNWREWSAKDGPGFPAKFARDILALNESQGLPEFASFGYRVMYASYVLDYEDNEAMDFAEYAADEVL